MSYRKSCTKCGEEKDIESFPFRRDRGQHHTQCRSCLSAYRLSRPRSVNYRKTNRDSYRRNPDPYRKARAKRRAAELQRTPAWSSQEFEKFALGEIYECRRLRTEATGVPHEVDHIIPLQGETVSGLHVAANLQVITRTENRSKSNAHEHIPTSSS